jgi:transposase
MVRRSEIDGVPAAAAAAAFGFSRQSLYTAKSVLAEQGLAGLIPARPGPRGGHKLTEEVVDLLEELLAADATLRPAGLAAALRQRTGISVHPRSAERALSRRRAARAARAGQPGQDDPKSG